MPNFDSPSIPLVRIRNSLLDSKDIQLYLLREDLIDSEISGNKWRKLKYNLAHAKQSESDGVLTFGGAYSNHIAATAAAGRIYDVKTIGLIRGEKTEPLNPTLQKAVDDGMLLEYISRSDFQRKSEEVFLNELRLKYGNVTILPEGGSNELAVKGCLEILENVDLDFDLVTVAVGTGGTMAGLICSTDSEVIGFPALKGGEFLTKDIQELMNAYGLYANMEFNKQNWKLITGYHFGGYAKITPELVGFVREFKANHQIELDLIYTGKMMFGVFDIIKTSSMIDGKTIVAIHTGGVQGNKGFQERFGVSI